MKLSLGARLTASYLLVILLAIGLSGPLAWLAVEYLYQNTQGRNLAAQAELIASALDGPPVSAAEPVPYSQLSNAMPGIHTRVLDSEGAVVISLTGGGADPVALTLALPGLVGNAAGSVTREELFSRPEIQQALAGTSATAIRRVEAAGGQRVLYAAAPVLDGRAPGAGVAQIVYLAMPLPDTRWTALPASLRWGVAGILLAAWILAGAAGLAFARRIARPVGELASAARAVGEGDLNRSVPADPAIPELATLGEAFNEMTASLRRSDQLKSEFIANISHELRTPLTVLKGTLETLQDGAIDDLEARTGFLEAMDGETERLIRLVNDLLVLTRADAGALQLNLQPVDLADLARRRCERWQPLAFQKKVILKVTTPAQSCFVRADLDRLAQVLDNLLDNAIRYSPVAGKVEIRLACEGAEVACQVSDHGAGIPPEHLPRIFERFYRVEASRDRSQGGNGLGLAIVHDLVAAHSGRVAAQSTLWQGTTITFWLPALEPGD